MVTDHLGNEFETQKEMCEYYDISNSTFCSRIKKGWKLEKALTTPKISNKILYYDHLGHKFSSFIALSKAYNIDARTLRDRLKKMSLKDALITPIVYPGKPCYDHKGNKFNSKREMCEFYGISVSQFNKRISSGQALSEALTIPIDERYSSGSKPCIDFQNNIFKSESEMCRYYNISLGTYRSRINNGWSKKEALTRKTKRGSYKKYYDHVGNEYKNLTEMCKFYNIQLQTFNHRIKHGWTIEEALLIKKNIKLYRSALFRFNNNDYLNWTCPVCKYNHILSKKEIRQHYLTHIKNGEIDG